jgi:formate dehydrogenase subunit gamma
MSEASSGNSQIAAASSPRVARHKATDRLYHWLMAICIFTLMGTAFLPILGFKFEWLDIHWMTGVALTVLVIFHIVRAIGWQDWHNMWIGFADIRDLWCDVAHLLGARKSPHLPGKYDAAQKLYHLGVAIVVLSVIGSGLLMLLKIDTPLWRRNPYLLSSDTWGIVYVVHGMAAMTIITIVIVHLYFTLMPSSWYMLRAMIRGSISRKEYLEHYDAERWKA